MCFMEASGALVKATKTTNDDGAAGHRKKHLIAHELEGAAVTPTRLLLCDG